MWLLHSIPLSDVALYFHPALSPTAWKAILKKLWTRAGRRVFTPGVWSRRVYLLGAHVGAGDAVGDLEGVQDREPCLSHPPAHIRRWRWNIGNHGFCISLMIRWALILVLQPGPVVQPRPEPRRRGRWSVAPWQGRAWCGRGVGNPRRTKAKSPAG